MAEGNLLIVAPDSDLRHSLEFVLESEGYSVTSSATIEEQRDRNGFDCTVLDHRAAIGPRQDVIAFCKRSNPIVLLAGMPQPWLSEQVFRTVAKPMLGEPLSTAVRDALGSRVSTK